MQDVFFIGAGLIIFIYSIVLHEVAHGWVADKLGDRTARMAGRITLNPIPHIDPFGSIILPGVLIVLNVLTSGIGVIFGWANPVPYNPMNLKNPKTGSMLIALAGPFTNILIAVFASIGAYLLYQQNTGDNLDGLIGLLGFTAIINTILALFNLLPIPPLDGSKVLLNSIPMSNETRMIFEQYGIILLLAFVFFTNIFGTIVHFFLPFIIGFGNEQIADSIIKISVQTVNIF